VPGNPGFTYVYKYDTSWGMAKQSPSRPVRYRDIASTLRDEVRTSQLSAGSVLPSEATLSDRFGASRVTVRRALEVLREEGLLSSRQGAGWFVAVDLVQQSLGSLGTIEDQLAASDRTSEREILGFAFDTAPEWVAEVLGTQSVLVVHRRNFADSMPFARVTVWCPQDLGEHLTRAQVEASPFYDLLGIELRGATQTIGATAVTADDAALLDVPEGSPVLRCTRTTRDIDRRAVLVSEHVFPAHLTEFVVDVPQVGGSLTPNGLRIVEAG
jgi:GntR family transcriptional regulator